jgi:hypothetical protein
LKNKFSFLFLVSTACFFWSCDLDRDNPLPSEIQGFQAVNYKVAFNPMGPVAISLYDSLPFKNEFTLKLENPANGTLEKGSVPGQYFYTPNHLSVVRDEVAYTVCQGNDCKSGKILFEVSPVTCHLSIHEDTFFRFLRDTIFIPVQDNDSLYCPDIRFEDFKTTTPGARIFGDNHFAAVVPPPFFSGTLQFSYTITNGIRRATSNVELETTPDTVYCNSHFELTDDRVVFPPSASVTEVPVFISDFLDNDKFCDNYINPASLEIFTETGQTSLITFTVSGNQVHFQIPGNTSRATLAYRVTNLAGTITKTAHINFVNQ